MKATATVHPLDFTVLSGPEFERLVLAFLWRRWPWKRLDWYGQLGDDGGRDIVGVRESDHWRDDTVVVACANWQRLTANKVFGDINKIAAGPAGVPDHLIILGGGKVSSDLRDKATTHARSRGILRSEVWSGPEFEEQLRLHAGTVLRRFFAGEALPDVPDELRAFVVDSPATEVEALSLVTRLFERPAFSTTFQHESSLPAFDRALADTIEALNTGIYRNRDGVIIARLPSRFDFPTPAVRETLARTVRALNDLRAAFAVGRKLGTIRPCGCGKPECPTFMVDGETCHRLDQLRRWVLKEASAVVPGLDALAAY
jgi:hypothetical protein